MKTLLSLLGMLLGLVLVSSETFEAQHRAELNKLRYGALIQPDLTTEQWYFTPGPPARDWPLSPPSAHAIRFDGRDDGGTLDLDRVAPGKPRLGDEGVVHILFHSSHDGVTRLGLSCDWWCEAYLNGVLCLSTMARGNGPGDSFEPEDHPFFAPVRKGMNQLTVRVRRGASSWRFACGRTRFRKLPVTEVEAGPWLLAPDSTSMTVLFRTAGKLSSGVRYRVRGEKAWRSAFDHRGGRIEERELHRVALTHLTPGTEYEYQIVMLAPDDANIQVVDPAVHFFRTPDEHSAECRFLFFADLQFLPEVQKRVIGDLLRHAGAADCDFIVLGGDLCDFFTPEILEQNVLPLFPEGKPLVVLRGNHELRGAFADRYPDYFAWPDGGSYALFRWGNTAFLALDSFGKHAAAPQKNEMGRLLPDVVDTETEFVARAVCSERWTKAARRVVLAHGAACSHPLSEPITATMAFLTDRWFAGRAPRSRLDLWLAGHMHQYSRTIPGTELVASWTPLAGPVRNAQDYTFPVLTVAGPDPKEPIQSSVFRVEIDAGKIRVRAFAPDGSCFEDVEYRRDGETVEHCALPRRKY